MTRRRRFLLLSIIVLFAVLIDAGPVAAAKAGPAAFSRHRSQTPRDCSLCHKNGFTLSYRHIRGNGRFFRAGHKAASCKACHAGENYFSLNRRRCQDCHKRRHGTDFVDRCGRCHSTSAWRPAVPTHTGKLGGAHSSLRCGACHRRNRYTGLNNWRCVTCHSRPSGHLQGACRRCHTTKAWRPATGGHLLKLTGVHTRLTCVKCHRGRPATQLNWACKSCHALKHNAAYGVKCGACHAQKSWKPAKMNHGAVKGDCSACHKSPAGHFNNSCNQCHQASRGWTAQFNHPGVGEHSYKSFPCNYCHPGGYTSYTCTRCHQSGAPKDD